MENGFLAFRSRAKTICSLWERENGHANGHSPSLAPRLSKNFMVNDERATLGLAGKGALEMVRPCFVSVSELALVLRVPRSQVQLGNEGK